MNEKNTEPDWEQVERVFHEALAKPATERAAFLDAACGANQVLRREIDTMLSADADVEGVLDRPLPVDDLAVDAVPAALIGGQIVGSWRIVSELGRGGMGVVYLAERADGTFEQQVALKVIRGGIFAAGMEPRFMRERHILGRLQHPNIARLLDAGATTDGLPFLVMELVRGEPITTWSQTRKCGIDERLRLMLQVCDALQHAHSNLVVHRDLKPGNIFVSDEGKVRLLDFGVARLLASPETDEMPLTRAGFAHITPEYAAPEQLGGGAITTATDIFALGAVLYELLSTQPPRQKTTGSPAELLQTLEHEIGPPSKAANLPDGWRQKLRGDIDAIVAKATAPDIARRYASVGELAEDIRRHLAHEPVLARPESIAYRASKFVRRHRFGAAAMLAITIAIGVGVATTAWQAGEAAVQARKADAVKEFVLSLFAGVDPAEALGEELTARQLVDTGAERIQTELVSEPVVRAEILTFLADMYDKMDQDDRAVELIDEALELVPVGDSIEYARAHLVRGRILIGKSEDEEGIASLDLAMPVLEAEEADLDQAEVMDLKSIALSREGNIDAALQLARSALSLRVSRLGENHGKVATSYNNLGVLARSKGDYAASRQQHERALDIRQRVLPAMHPQIGLSLNNLGALEYAVGNFARAADYFEESLVLQTQVNGAAHHDTIASLNNFGMTRLRLGQLDEAKNALSDVYQYWVDQDKAEHPNALVTRVNLATVMRAAGDVEAALAEYRELEKKLVPMLGEDHPFVAATLHYQARCYVEFGDLDTASELIARALDMRNKAFGPDHPDSAELIRDQGVIALLENDIPSARTLAERAYGLQTSKLSATHPSLSVSRVLLGKIFLAEGNTGEALTLQRQALADLSSMFPEDNVERADAHFELGRTLLANGKTTEALVQFEAARAALTKRYGAESWKVAKANVWLAAALEAEGRSEEAATLRSSAVQTINAQLPDYHPVRREIAGEQI